MSFEDGTQTGPAPRSLGVSSGEFRAVQRDTRTFEAVPALVAAPGHAEPATSAQPNLHYVFDDPNDGEPGRDRMLVHLLWELVLAAGTVAAGFALVKARPGALHGDSLRAIALATALVGLLALASSVALRAAVPNLAVGPVAVFAAVLIGRQDEAWGAAMVTVVGICAVIGLVLGLVTVGLHVPSWAASLGAAVALAAWVTTQKPTAADLSYDPVPDAYLWFVGFAAVSVVACVIGLVPGVRRGFGRYRAVADPAKRRTRVAELIAVAVTVASMTVAGLAGSLYAVGAGSRVLPQGADPWPALVVLAAVGLGTALLGGTSAYGRRGGILGTVLAACLVEVTLEWVVAARPTWSVLLVPAVAIGLGLAVTRLVERFGRPVLLPPDDEESWIPRTHSPALSSAPWRPGPTPAGGLWSDEGWGSPPR